MTTDTHTIIQALEMEVPTVLDAADRLKLREATRCWAVRLELTAEILLACVALLKREEPQ